jgi:hypothetical protein
VDVIAVALAIYPVASSFFAFRHEVVAHGRRTVPPAAFDPFRPRQQAQRLTITRPVLAQHQGQRLLQ